MAINVSYSPVATAVGLAAQAGVGQRVRQQQQYDLQLQDLVNQMQAHSDSVNANQISQAMEEQRIGLGANESQQRMHDQMIQQQALDSYRQANLMSASQNHNAVNQINQQRADAQTTAAGAQQDNANLGQAKFADKQDAINQLPTDEQTIVRAQGHLQSAGANAADPRHFALQQYKAYERDLQQAMKDQQAATYDPNDKRKFLAEQSSDNPDAIKGMESAYSAAAKRVADAQQKLKALNDQLNPQPNNIPVSPQAMQQIAQQNQQGQGPAQQLQAQPQQQQGQPAVVNTQEDYAQLPSGTLYVDAQDGQIYRKR